MWHALFPGRTLAFEDHQPTVINTTSGTAVPPYRAHMMSDGERVALYVAARVLLAPAGILVVDEPELLVRAAVDDAPLRKRLRAAEPV
jgi:hypothetical protein